MKIDKKFGIIIAIILTAGLIYVSINYLRKNANNVVIQKKKKHCKYGKGPLGICKPKPMTTRDHDILVGVGTLGIAPAITAAMQSANGEKVTGGYVSYLEEKRKEQKNQEKTSTDTADTAS